MAIYSLNVMKIGDRSVFICPKCKAPGMDALGAQNRDQLVYLLLCGKCFDTLAEWMTPEERYTELRQLAARLMS